MLKEVPRDIESIDISKTATEIFMHMDLDMEPVEYYKLEH